MRSAFARVAGLALAVCSCLGSVAKAGPIELFSEVSIESGRPDFVALQYIYGGGGMFLSRDGGQSYALLCYAAIDSSVQRDASTLHVSGAHQIFVGVFSGLWRGDESGCSWSEVPELKGNWVSAIAADPLDAKRSYLITSTGGQPNGLWVNDGISDGWSELGSRDELFLNTLHVIETGEASERFYVTGVKMISAQDPTTGAPLDQLQYQVRVSDDGGKTWTENVLEALDQFGAPDRRASMRILTVSPTYPDVLVAVVVRDQGLDDLIYSERRGEPGSWHKLAELTQLRAAAFGPDGQLYFGNYDQNDKSLWVSELGGTPRQLSSDWKVGCLHYDQAHHQLYGCNDWLFGTVDLESGVLTTSLDMRTAEQFVECSHDDGTSTADVCRDQLLNAYCGAGHYPQAPLCSGYPQAVVGLGGGRGGTGEGGGDGRFGPLPPLASDQGDTPSAAGGGGGAAGHRGAGCSVAPGGGGGWVLALAFAVVVLGIGRRTERRG